LLVFVDSFVSVAAATEKGVLFILLSFLSATIFVSTSASDLGSPVSKDYFDLASFAFNGTIGTTKIWYPKK